jgi:uncharacterized protein
MSRYYAIFATDRSGMQDVRERVRPAHRAYLRAPTRHGVFVRLGGATLDQLSEAMNGTLLILEAECIEDVESFLGGDPYMQAGLFEHIEIRPWDWSVGNPERRV